MHDERLSELSEQHGAGARDLVAGILWLIRLRWLSVAVLLAAIPITAALLWVVARVPTLATIGGKPFPLPATGTMRVPVTALLLFAALIALFNAAYAAALRRWKGAGEDATRTLTWFVNAQIAVDLVTLTGIGWAFGSFESLVLLYMIFHMIGVASVLPPRAAYAQALLGVALISLLANLEYYELVPHSPVLPIQASFARDPDYLGLFVVLMSTMLVASVFLTRHLSGKVRRSQERLKARVLELSSFYNTVRIIGSTLELDAVFDQVMDQFRRVYLVERYALYLLDEETGTLHLHASSGDAAAADVAVADAVAGIGRGVELTPGGGGRGPSVRTPLRVRDRDVGLLEVHKGPGEEFGDMELELLQTIGSNVALAVVNAEIYGAVEREAITDGLTGLTNRRHFFRLLEQELERAARYERPLTLLLLDVDHFKGFNDGFGHLAGDQVLREVAELVRGEVRSVDVAARYGGEEMVVALPETSLAQAEAAGERLRRRIDDHVFSDTLPEGARHVTVSVGVAVWSPPPAGEPVESAESLVRRADGALYAAKDGGRNCTRLAAAGT